MIKMASTPYKRQPLPDLTIEGTQTDETDQSRPLKISLRDVLDEQLLVRLKVGVDNGTVNSCTCFGPAILGQSPAELLKQRYYGHDQGHAQSPTKAAFYRDNISMQWKLVFGTRVDELLAQGEILEDQVLKLLKLDVVPQDHPCRKDALTTRWLDRVQQDHNHAFQIYLTPRRRFSVYDPFTDTWIPCEIKTTLCVLREYLRFQLQLVKKEIHSSPDCTFTEEEVESIIINRTDIAVSVPAMSNQAMRNTYRCLLAAAGYPRSTFITSEAKSSAISYAMKLMQEPKGTVSRLLRGPIVVADIGGATLDLTVVSVNKIDPKPEIEERATSSGSMLGSGVLNVIFIRYMKAQLGEELDQAAKRNGLSVEMFLSRLARDFEIVKCIFTNDADQTKWRVQSNDELSLWMPDLPESTNICTDGGLVLSSKALKHVFGQWLDRVFADIKKYVKGHKDLRSRSSFMLAFTGRGMLPPYVQDGLRTRVKNELGKKVSVQFYELPDVSTVAEGGYVSALDVVSDGGFMTNSYGVCVAEERRNQISFRDDNGKELKAPEIATFARWLATAGTCISGGSCQYTGIFLVHNCGTPISLELDICQTPTDDESSVSKKGFRDIYSFLVAGVVSISGRMSINGIIDTEKFELGPLEDGTNAFRIPFQVQIRSEGLSKIAQFFVYKGSKFPNAVVGSDDGLVYSSNPCLLTDV